MIDDFCWSQSIDLFLKNMAKAFFRVRELFLHSLTLIQALDDFRDVQTRLHIEVVSGSSKHPGFSFSSISTIFLTIVFGVKIWLVFCGGI